MGTPCGCWLVWARCNQRLVESFVSWPAVFDPLLFVAFVKYSHQVASPVSDGVQTISNCFTPMTRGPEVMSDGRLSFFFTQPVLAD